MQDVKMIITNIFFDKEIKISPFSNVFKGIFLRKLNKIVISSFTSKLKIQIINENAFYFYQINTILFEHNDIKLIKKDAFLFSFEHNKYLVINFF